MRQDDETKMTLWAVACGVASMVCLIVAIQIADRPPARAASGASARARSTWIDSPVAPAGLPQRSSPKEFPPAPRPAAKSTPSSPPAPDRDPASHREDLALVAPSTVSIVEEVAVRRHLAELGALEAAHQARAMRISLACDDACAAGLQDEAARGALAREASLSGRARLSSRGESVARVERSLEFAGERP